MAKIRVLLVDDQKLFVDSLKIVLQSRTDDMDVVGVASNGEEAISMAGRHKPDVILLDVRMPGMDGVEAARILHERYPEIRIVMLTTYDDDEYVRDAIKYGAAGYLLKSIPPSELAASIRVAATGTIQISPEVAGKVLRDSAQVLIDSTGPDRLPQEIRELYETLTNREREVLALLTKAYDNHQIADALNIADQTVKNHVHAIYDKLYVSNRMQLIQLMNRMS
jgi:DNA-binding NarL/FixJ family response regulator